MPHNLAEPEKKIARETRIKLPQIKHPVIVAMVGVVGSGKSAVAKTLATALNWNVVKKDKIRIALRETSHGFTLMATDKIFFAVIKKAISEGDNIICDFDAVEKQNRKKLKRFAEQHDARVAYIHTICNRDVMIERLLHAPYQPNATFFKNAAIAVREHCRRYPWHYRWQTANGGRYLPRRLPIKFFSEIDTTNPETWKKKLYIVAKRLKKL